MLFDFILPFGIGVIVVGTIQTILSHLWFCFRWRVFGWRPKIFNEEMVKKTVEECSQFGIEDTEEQFKEMHDREMTWEERQHYFEQIQKTFRHVIDLYVLRFSGKC